MSARRLLYVLQPAPGHDLDGEGWKRGRPEGAPDAEAVRAQLREQLTEGVPVLVLPEGLTLWVIDLDNDRPEGAT